MAHKSVLPAILLSGMGILGGIGPPGPAAAAAAGAGDGIPSDYIAENVQAVGYLDMQPLLKLAIHEAGGRWYLYGGNIWTSGWSVMEVTDPARPVLLKSIAGPDNTWTGQVEVEAGKMMTALQSQPPSWGGDPSQPFGAGFVTWDLSDPANPERLADYSTGGTGSHRLGYYGGPYVHITAAIEGYRGDIYQIVDWEKNREVGRWWVPGQRDGEPPDDALLHGPPYVIGEQAYLPYGAAGMIILDIANLSTPELVSRLDFSPPFNPNIAVHSVLPLPGRDLAVVMSEAIRARCDEPLNFVAMVDIAERATPRLLSLFPVPVPPAGLSYADFCDKGARFGPHNLNQHRHSRFVENDEQRIYVAYFNAGLRVYDISNPRLPREEAFFIPPDPVKRWGPFPNDALVLESEDVLVDTRGFIYLSHTNQGLWILRLAGNQ